MSSAVEQEIIETPGALQLVSDADVDIQVATAKRFPRSITTFMRRAQEMATLTPEIAASCIYALPRKENGKQKNIEGPSARLAEICASAWGNLRAEGKVLGHDDQFVTSRGTSWDVETNVVIAYEVKRRITTSDGRLYSSDMIGVTGNAGASIALRNAILKNIPTPFWKPIYQACRQVIAGDAKTFSVRRDQKLHEFAVMGVTEERLLAAIGVKGKMDITFDHMATLAGFYTALKDGDTTIEEAFPEVGPLAGAPQPAQRKSAQNASAPTPPPVTVPPTSGMPEPHAATQATDTQPAQPAASAQTAENVGKIVEVIDRGAGAIVKLETGFRAGTADADTIRAAKSLRDKGTRVELTTRPPRDPKNAPTIVELSPLSDEGGAR